MGTTTRHIEAMDKIARLVNVRERNIKETKERLHKDGFTDEEIDEAIASALRCGLIDETRYARAYIRGKKHSGWGSLKIKQRLLHNGISEQVIQMCAHDFMTSEEEHCAALHELAKHPSRSTDPYSSYMRRLIGKGYPYEIASQAVKAHLAQEQ